MVIAFIIVRSLARIGLTIGILTSVKLVVAALIVPSNLLHMHEVSITLCMGIVHVSSMVTLTSSVVA